jgi:hypothetical protein
MRISAHWHSRAYRGTGAILECTPEGRGGMGPHVVLAIHGREPARIGRRGVQASGFPGDSGLAQALRGALQDCARRCHAAPP